MFPGKRNSLDALCERFGVDNAHRAVHGALLDAQLLAEVYLAMTRGQETLTIDMAAPALRRRRGRRHGRPAADAGARASVARDRADAPKSSRRTRNIWPRSTRNRRAAASGCALAAAAEPRARLNSDAAPRAAPGDPAVPGRPAFLLRSPRFVRAAFPVPMPVDYLQKILTAKVYDVAIESPLELAPALSRRLGNRVLLKREDQQPVFSFKLRGAYNKMAQLSAAERARGVIAASAGNHAQGVALAAQRLGCAATIVMPVTTPHIKIAAVEARGAKVVLHGDSYSDAYAHALVAAEALARRVRASLRRSRRDRRAGHGRHGDPAPVPGADRRDLRRDRRRRAHRAASPPT